MSSRRPLLRQTRGRVTAGAGSTSPPPAVPTLTAPASGANVFITIATTVSATSTDGDLTRMDWVLDPGGSEVVIATDAVAPYSQSWTPTGITVGDHTLVARAVRGAQSTDSASITVHVGVVFSNLVPSVTVSRLFQTDFKVTDAGGGKCNSWGDVLSANAATQATGSAQPAIGVGLNGHPKLTFARASSQFLKDNVMNFPAPLSVPYFIWVVASLDTWQDNDSLITGGTLSAPLISALTSSPNIVSYNGVASSLNGGATLGTPAVFEAYFSNTTGDYLKVGSTTVTGTILGNTDPGVGLFIGSRSAANFADCTFYAVMICLGLPNGSELAALRAAAMAMYPGVSA